MIKRTRKFLKKQVQKIKSRLRLRSRSRSKSSVSCKSRKQLKGGRSKLRTKVRKVRTRVHTKVNRKNSVKRIKVRRSNRGGAYGVDVNKYKINALSFSQYMKLFKELIKKIDLKIDGIFRKAGSEKRVKSFFNTLNIEFNIEDIKKKNIDNEIDTNKDKDLAIIWKRMVKYKDIFNKTDFDHLDQIDRQQEITQNFKIIQDFFNDYKINNPQKYVILGLVLQYFKNATEQNEQLDPYNISVYLGPTLFPFIIDADIQTSANSITQFLLENCDAIFTETKDEINLLITLLKTFNNEKDFMKLLNLISENIDGFGLSTDSEAQPQYRINKKPIKCSSRFGKFKSLFGVGGPKERLLYELVITKIVNSDVGFVNNMYMYSDENNNIKGIILSIKKATAVENKIIFDKDGTQVVSLVCPKVQTINDLEFEIIQKYKQSATFNPTDTNLTQETQQHNNEGYDTLTLGTPNINRTTKPLKINDTVILKTDLIKMKEPELKKRYIITNIKNENEITIQTGEGE